MTDIIKIIASTAATGIAIIAYIPYLIDMFRGKNQPHIYTWISITLVTAVVAYIQLIGGAGIGAIPTIIGVIIDFIILFYCFKFGTKDIVNSDKIFLSISVVGVLSFAILSNHPVISLTIVTIAEIASFIPTFRKTKNDPYSESLTSYYLLMIKLILVLVALEKYNILTVSYSVLWLAVFVVFLTTTHIWRRNVDMSRRKETHT
ncbi:MAG: hypothetical protein COY80_03305 [Candidatus Pacebacteria bacterium CG_4_10_14_0_8_um_filter_42_14]|nr:MAG: hypothetical protein COY80_03305 [Candidatus Pacebacteria bacterium CG_4_10_14_0_8_um_filter_42_14]